MIDAIDLLKIPLVIEKIDRKEPITERERRVLADYLEEFPLGMHAQDVKARIGIATIAAPEPMPSPEDLEALLEKVSEQEKQQKADRRKRKK